MVCGQLERADVDLDEVAAQNVVGKLAHLAISRLSTEVLARILQFDGNSSIHKAIITNLTWHFKSTNLLGPGGAPHEHLAVWPDLGNDFAQLRLKAHVKHTVSLVQHL